MSKHIAINPLYGPQTSREIRVYAINMENETNVHRGTLSVTSNGITESVTLTVLPKPSMTWDGGYGDIPKEGGVKYLTVVSAYPFKIYNNDWYAPITLYRNDDGYTAEINEFSNNDFDAGRYTIKAVFYNNESGSDIEGQLGIEFYSCDNQNSITSTGDIMEYRSSWLTNWKQLSTIPEYAIINGFYDSDNHLITGLNAGAGSVFLDITTNVPQEELDIAMDLIDGDDILYNFSYYTPMQKWLVIFEPNESEMPRTLTFRVYGTTLQELTYASIRQYGGEM